MPGVSVETKVIYLSMVVFMCGVGLKFSQLHISHWVIFSHI